MLSSPTRLSSALAGGLSSSGTQGGPFSPSSQTYTLQNTGSISMNWTASKTAAWTALSATSGTLAPGAWTTTRLSTTHQPNSFAAANFTDTLTFTNCSNFFF